MNTSTICIQLICIIGNILVLGLVFYILCEMPYNFKHILFRWWLHNDKKPLDWLIKNLKYLGLGIYFLGHLFAVKGLLYQLGHNQLENKPFDFYISSPLSNYGIGLFLFDYIKTPVYKLAGKILHKGN